MTDANKIWEGLGETATEKVATDVTGPVRQEGVRAGPFSGRAKAVKGNSNPVAGVSRRVMRRPYDGSKGKKDVLPKMPKAENRPYRTSPSGGIVGPKILSGVHAETRDVKGGLPTNLYKSAAFTAGIADAFVELQND